jgi:hypothetical protein
MRPRPGMLLLGSGDVVAGLVRSTTRHSTLQGSADIVRKIGRDQEIALCGILLRFGISPGELRLDEAIGSIGFTFIIC